MKRTMPVAGRCLLAFASLLATPLAVAQSPEELRREVERRDRVITDLEQRVRTLEERLGQKPAPGQAVRPQKPEEAVDEELLSRALERSLVRSGGVLLQSGQKEIEPALQYEHTRRSGLAIVGGGVAQQDLRVETAYAFVGFRAGLPWSSQLELAIPFARQKVETVTGGTTADGTDSGVGDWTVGWSKQLLTEREGGRPGLIGNLTYQNSRIGNSNLATLLPGAALLPASTPSIGQGYDSLHARLTAVKRMDPLVFVGALGRAFNRTADVNGARIDPGDTNSASVRAILAASPDVSLRTGFSIARSPNVRVNGASIPASNATLGVLDFGTSVVLSRSTLLDVSVGVGVTESSPDFFLNVSLPVRF